MSDLEPPSTGAATAAALGTGLGASPPATPIQGQIGALPPPLVSICGPDICWNHVLLAQQGLCMVW